MKLLQKLYKGKLEEKVGKGSLKEDAAPEELVYAVTYSDSFSRIFMYVDGYNDLLIADRWHRVSALCVHDGWLYDGGFKFEKPLGFVINTLAGKDIIPRSKLIFSLCSHEGVLYAGGDRDIFEVCSGKEVTSGEWMEMVNALCSHKGVLYGGGKYSGLYDALKGKKIRKKCSVTSLCSHEDRLYWGGYMHMYDYWPSYRSVVFNESKGRKVVEMKSDEILALCSCKERLYDAGTYGINNTLSQLGILITKRGSVTAMCSVPSELAEQIRYSRDKSFDPVSVQKTNPKGFIKYFNILSEERKKDVVGKLFSCDYVHEDVVDWLNKYEKELMRGIVFS